MLFINNPLIYTIALIRNRHFKKLYCAFFNYYNI